MKIQPLPPIQRNVLDVPLCRKCAGRCCQGSPGLWVDPQRFFALFCARQHLTLGQLRAQLSELDLVLWEKTGVPMPAPRSLATGCVYLAPAGCRFSIDERPCQCLALIPNAATLEQQQGCLCRLPTEFSREQAKQNWQEYWWTLNRSRSLKSDPKP